MATATEDEFFGRAGPPRGGCQVCGGESGLRVQARATTLASPSRTRSRSVTLCLEHAAELYERMEALVDQASRGQL